MTKLLTRQFSLMKVSEISLFLILVVPKISEHSVGALSVGLSPIGESEIIEYWCLEPLSSNLWPWKLYLCVIRYNALVLRAVNVEHYHWLDGLGCGLVTGVVVSGAVGIGVSGVMHDSRIHIYATIGVRHVSVP